MTEFTPHESFTIHKPTVRYEKDSLFVACSYTSEPYEFTETFDFSFPSDINVDEIQLEAMAELIAIAAAPSYYKATRARKITIEFSITEHTKLWVNGLFDQGLGEFRYRNNFRDEQGYPDIIIPEIIAEEKLSSSNAVRGNQSELTRCLVPIGGGKDSATTLEIMQRAEIDVLGFEVGDFPAIEQTASVAGVNLVHVKRTLDPFLFELNAQGAPNGHVPVTALVSTLACLAALVNGIPYVAMSNEASADEETVLTYYAAGESSQPNHQWSKSSEAEKLLADAIISTDIPIHYFSALRSLSELEIFSLFSTLEKYHSVFTSCNRAFHIDKEKRSRNWCGECDKCRFVFLSLCAYCDIDYVSNIFGKNLFEDENNIQGFMNLFDYTEKPFECVGTITESHAMAHMAFTQEKVKETKFGKKYDNYQTHIDPFDPRSKVRHRDRIKSDSIPSKILDSIEVFACDVYRERAMNFFTNKTVACIGLGRDTAGVIHYLRSIGFTTNIPVYFPEQITRDRFEELCIQHNLDANAVSIIENPNEIVHDIVFVSPGISKYDDEIQKLDERATTPLAFWLALNMHLLPHAFFIGVTGTKGKSTVSSMLHSVLPYSILAGNIGESVGSIPIVELVRADYIVLETSSFQSSYITHSPDAVVLTSLFDCHIDWHRTPENYRRDKLNIMLHGPSLVFASGILDSDDIYSELKVKNVLTVAYDPTKSIQQNNNRLVEKTVETIRGRSQELDWQLTEALEQFTGLKYRKEVVAVKNGVTYISDVLSTAPNAVLMSVDDMKIQYPDATIYLLCGGAYRDVSLDELVEGLNERSKDIVTIALPETGHMIESKLLRTQHAENLVEAIDTVKKTAKNGDVVLLAPGAPSFHRYKDYTELAADFEKLVAEI